MNNTDSKSKYPVTFAAIDTYVERHIISPKESKPATAERFRWGDGDKYPGYLAELYDNVTTLRSVIDGCVDFFAGDNVLFRGTPDAVANKTGETYADVIRACGHNLYTYGGAALEIVRDKDGNPSEIYAVDMRFLRTNEDNTVFWYSEKWGKSTSTADAEEMPAYMPIIRDEWWRLTPEERDRAASSILYVKRDRTHVYPAPPYAAAVKACEIERCIDDYHLNALDNGFAGSALVNMNNGDPGDDDIKEEISRTFNEKFSGHSNAGRIVFSWNPNKESAATIETIKVEDFGERYQALAKHSRQQIFAAFRANPNLFGIPTESLGFSSEEYESAFKLFNRTQVRPMQRLLADAFAKIFGEPVLQIIPFSLDGDTEAAVN